MPLIGGTCSYLHMHLLVELHGQPGCGGGRCGYAAELMNSTTCGEPRRKSPPAPYRQI